MIGYANKFSIPVNNDISEGSLKDLSSQMLMTLTFMFLKGCVDQNCLVV